MAKKGMQTIAKKGKAMAKKATSMAKKGLKTLNMVKPLIKKLPKFLQPLVMPVLKKLLGGDFKGAIAEAKTGILKVIILYADKHAKKYGADKVMYVLKGQNGKKGVIENFLAGKTDEAFRLLYRKMLIGGLYRALSVF